MTDITKSVEEFITLLNLKVRLSDFIGQFVNLPYQNAKFPTRCAMDDDGNSLKYADYLSYAKKFIITKDNAPSCNKFLETIQLLIFFNIRKKIIDKKITVPTMPCSDKNSK